MVFIITIIFYSFSYCRFLDEGIYQQVADALKSSNQEDDYVYTEVYQEENSTIPEQSKNIEQPSKQLLSATSMKEKELESDNWRQIILSLDSVLDSECFLLDGTFPEYNPHTPNNIHKPVSRIDIPASYPGNPSVCVNSLKNEIYDSSQESSRKQQDARKPLLSSVLKPPTPFQESDLDFISSHQAYGKSDFKKSRRDSFSNDSSLERYKKRYHQNVNQISEQNSGFQPHETNNHTPEGAAAPYDGNFFKKGPTFRENNDQEKQLSSRESKTHVESYQPTIGNQISDIHGCVKLRKSPRNKNTSQSIKPQTSDANLLQKSRSDKLDRSHLSKSRPLSAFGASEIDHSQMMDLASPSSRRYGNDKSYCDNRRSTGSEYKFIPLQENFKSVLSENDISTLERAYFDSSSHTPLRKATSIDSYSTPSKDDWYAARDYNSQFSNDRNQTRDMKSSDNKPSNAQDIKIPSRDYIPAYHQLKKKHLFEKVFQFFSCAGGKSDRRESLTEYEVYRPLETLSMAYHQTPEQKLNKGTTLIRFPAWMTKLPFGVVPGDDQSNCGSIRTFVDGTNTCDSFIFVKTNPNRKRGEIVRRVWRDGKIQNVKNPEEEDEGTIV